MNLTLKDRKQYKIIAQDLSGDNRRFENVVAMGEFENKFSVGGIVPVYLDIKNSEYYYNGSF